VASCRASVKTASPEDVKTGDSTALEKFHRARHAFAPVILLVCCSAYLVSGLGCSGWLVPSSLSRTAR
jgi:hypothetical protein